MQRSTLIILAAGLGSRFGEGIKQLTPVGPAGELIIDYSVHDALAAGFDKVVFIIRRDLEEEFRRTIGKRTEARCEVAYVFQELDALPSALALPVGRIKPWGTAQALLLCRDVVKEPFCVINADDYYGKEAFVKMHAFLMEHAEAPYEYAMAGFQLQNTLSDHGSVTRGVCRVDDRGRLTNIIETKQLVKCPGGAKAELTGTVYAATAPVSMNMWGMKPEIFDVLEQSFAAFLNRLTAQDALTAEYLLPAFIGGLVLLGSVSVTVLETKDAWFGVTYAADRPAVQQAFARLVERGAYPSPLC